MADLGIVRTFWASTDDAVKKAAQATFAYLLKTLKIGPAEDQEIAGNLGGIWYKATTSTTANQEFSILHQQNQVPTMILAGAPLNVVGARIVDLQVTRAADASRLYLSSPSTGAVVYLYVEFGGL